jgi:pyruvate formate lyase activating enzyme
MQTATVFNIQKFSLNDGPGIRTVVFLKGCPLRCYWCSNPESQVREPQVEWNERACIGCGRCLEELPGARAIKTGSRRHVDVGTLDARDEHVRRAVQACPMRALSVVGETKDVEEVLEECLKDLPFYRQSGGGVTISGGEPLVWPDFCRELVERLHEEGVDTNMETTAHVNPAAFDAVTRLLDHVYIDMKHGGPREHRAGTGVENDLILANTAHAIAAGTDVLVRIPVIPGFNDSVQVAGMMAARLAEVGATRVQLLPFHNFGESKYDLLGRDYRLRGRKGLQPEDLEAYQKVFSDAGIDTFF